MMLPTLASPNLIDCWEAYSKLLGDFRSAHLATKISNLRDFVGSQFSEMGFLPEKQRRFAGFQDPNRMDHIFSWSDYFKIFCPRIIAYAIFVIDHLIGRYRPNKGFGYEPMHTFYAAFTSKTHAWVARIITARFHDSLSRAFHSSLITDLISREPLNRLPFFCHAGLLFRCFDSLAGCGEYA